MKYKTYSFKIVEPLVDGSDAMTPHENLNNAIFLAGPCPRKNYEEDWRFEAYDILEELGFSGTVITPTNPNYMNLRSQYGDDALLKQTDWERIAMHLATVIAFWIPRSEQHPAFTTNIEFGEWYKKPNICVGWPDGAIKNDYLGLKMAEQHLERSETLRDLLEKAIAMTKSTGTSYFTADTHFGQQRTLELSRRPFHDVKEMDLTLMSNWNKSVTMDDVVYHAGDFIDPEHLDWLKWYLDNLNFKELHWTLGNYDRKNVETIKSIVDACERPIILYEEPICRIEGPKHTFIIAHEPNLVPIEVGTKDDVILYGHIHGRSFAKQNGFDLAADYHGYAPISMEQVEWFANAMQYWDNNVFSMQCDTICDGITSLDSLSSPVK